MKHKRDAQLQVALQNLAAEIRKGTPPNELKAGYEDAWQDTLLDALSEDLNVMQILERELFELITGQDLGA